MVKPYPVQPYPAQAFPAAGLGLLINDILGIADPALPVPQLVAHDVTGGFQLPQSITDGVHALLADFRKATGGIVPVIRQGQHHGKQSLGLQRHSWFRR